MVKRILFVGEHPHGMTGNSQMLRGILEKLDYTDKEVSIFVNDSIPVNYAESLNQEIPYKVVSATDFGANDVWGMQKLLNLIVSVRYDLVFFVGLDIWRYAQIFQQMNEIRQNIPVKYAALFPYDLQMVRLDWIEWIKMFDYKFVYSEYGERILKPYIPDIKYYRPRICGNFIRLDEEAQKRTKRALTMSDEDESLFLFGFIGVNQVRKDPQAIIKAFSMIQGEYHGSRLYLHTDLQGVYNLSQYASDCGIIQGRLLSKQPGSALSKDQMATLYNGLDCYANCALQEGLSWAPLEAMLCGVPCILSDSTAHKELEGIFVKSNAPAYLDVLTGQGHSSVDAYKCFPEEIAKAMQFILDEYYNNRYKYIERCFQAEKFARNWQVGTADINKTLEDIFSSIEAATISVKENTKKDEVLFVQHSSAGDVLMTTQCFKGIKERHPNKRLVYMTQKKYQNIVEGNPWVDEIIDYHVPDIGKYLIVYNPHGEKILPGGWNNLDVTLHSMYPYFCKVEADDQFIKYIDCKPKDFPYEKGLNRDSPYIVVNSGGASEYRKYKHISIAVRNFDLKVVQLGDKTDPACIDALDLRDKLTWRESAWVMANARAAICVDSFCAHLAGAVDTPAVVLFGPAPARVTRPRYKDESKLICMEPNMLDVCPTTSHCYSNLNGRKKCTSPCINTISPLEVRKALLSLMEIK